MTGEEAYDWLMTGADRSCLDAFDLHVLASILALALAEAKEGRAAMTDRCGLDPEALGALAAEVFPGRLACLRALAGTEAREIEIEEESVRDLLVQHATGRSALEPTLAAMIARRAMEPDHLWQDLGMRNRKELSALLDRHFEPLARQNTRNMKWKRFFYRMICEGEGFSLCVAPVCSACTDVDMCFGEESGEARLARTSDPAQPAAADEDATA